MTKLRLYVVEAHADCLAKVPMTHGRFFVFPGTKKGKPTLEGSLVRMVAWQTVTDAFVNPNAAECAREAAQRAHPGLLLTIGVYETKVSGVVCRNMTPVVSVLDFPLLVSNGVFVKTGEWTEVD